MHRRDEPAPTTDLDDNAELLGEVRRLQEEVRVVYDAIDELREAIDQITRGYRQDDWRPVQPRQIVSLPLAPTDPEFARKINSIEPSTFPPDLPAEVVGILTTRLAADRRGDPNGSPPHSESFPVQDDVVLVAAGPVQQRSLWNGGGNESDVPPVRPATVLADAAAEATPQKEAERGSEPTDEVKPRYFAPLAGHELVAHMQRHKVTIAGLAKRTGIAQKRIRQAREAGLSDPHAVRDWLQAIIGRDPGAVGIRVARDAYTLDDWIAFRGRCVDGEIDAATLQAEFRRMQAGKQHFIETLLNAKPASCG